MSLSRMVFTTLAKIGLPSSSRSSFTKRPLSASAKATELNGDVGCRNISPNGFKPTGKELTREIVKDSRFSVNDLPLEFRQAVHITANSHSVTTNPAFPGEVFVFSEGVLSFWNITEKAFNSILAASRNHAEDIYPAELVKWESECMSYQHHHGSTKLKDGRFLLCAESPLESRSHDLFAFANALCWSVKLGHWERNLDSIIASLESIPASLIKGRKLKYHTPRAILRKIGEIQLIRHRVNLQHSLLDVPDTYWDRDDLEKLYLDTARFLNLNKRVHLVNEKLTYCEHMVELLKTDLHEKRSHRVEWLIVLLITIEVKGMKY